jgi:hypothetical protein
MNPDIDTRLPWNRGGPRVLILKREPTDELEAQDSGLWVPYYDSFF